MNELPEDLYLDSFSVEEAVARGISHHQLRRNAWLAPFYGVRMPRSQVGDFEKLCNAYATRMPQGHYFSHTSAARLWGMRLPARLAQDDVLDVTAVPPARASRSNRVRGHSSRNDAVTFHRGHPLTSPACTWRSLATRLSIEELIVAGDGLIQRKHPLATLQEIHAAVEKCAGQRGSVKAARALPHLRARTDSRRETELRRLLIVAGLPEPQVNLEISRPGADRKRFGDLVYPEWMVVVEYDGMHHSVDRATYADDLARGEELRDCRFVHVIKEHWKDADAIADRVDAALRANGWQRSRTRRRYLQSRRSENATSSISNQIRAASTSGG